MIQVFGGKQSWSWSYLGLNSDSVACSELWSFEWVHEWVSSFFLCKMEIDISSFQKVTRLDNSVQTRKGGWFQTIQIQSSAYWAPHLTYLAAPRPLIFHIHIDFSFLQHSNLALSCKELPCWVSWLED